MSDQKHSMNFKFPQSMKKNSRPAPKSEDSEPIEVISWDRSLFQKNHSTPQDNDDSHPEEDKVVDFTEKVNVKKSGNEPFWDDGDRSKGPKLPPKNRKNKIQLSIPWPIVGAVMSAIVVGLGLGIVVFQFFLNDDTAYSEAAIPAQATVYTDVAFPSLHVDVVQGAAFTDMETAEKVVSEIKEKGLPAVLIPGEETQYMFLGVANDQARGTELSVHYGEQGQETYVKTYTVEGGEVSVGGEDAASWYTSANAIYQFLNNVSSQFIVANERGSISEENIAQLNQSVEQLRDSRDRAFSQMNEQARERSLQYADTLFSAVKALNTYHESNENDALYQIQQQLLQMIVQYEDVLTIINEE
ncbi:hypothetical protein [Shouchella lehensis]|uniref:SPOR domain-containing protein n=1 Tax=Shouchella lehensis TaxID=300825 RepID=A0A4Y7WRI3_9BACI|nr:hypothetical protein [Shouchella lehensis]MBG9784009.1 hypothetical protein [Shouchella lehensis]TES51017.1 hypothetical protein E2L03_03595 [Shouchella lehensis]